MAYGYFDALVVCTEVGVLVDKTPEAMAAVKNRDQFHGAGSEWRETSTLKRQTRLAFPPRKLLVENVDRPRSQRRKPAQPPNWGNPHGRVMAHRSRRSFDEASVTVFLLISLIAA
jgi:hypothetical protein